MSDTIVITQNNIEVVEVTPAATPTLTVTETVNSVEVSAPGPQGPTGPQGPQGPAGAAGAQTLDDLTDVDIASVANGDVLSYNAPTSMWVNEARVLLTDGGNF